MPQSRVRSDSTAFEIQARLLAVALARTIQLACVESLVEYRLAGLHEVVVRGFPNVRKLDLPFIVQPEVEHAVRRTGQGLFLSVSLLVQQFNCVALRFPLPTENSPLGHRQR